jgi:XTP/dITP diphosphohydrolase
MADRPLLVLGTGNRKKGREMADLLVPAGVELRTLADFPNAMQVAEDGDTFAANAAKKAAQQARHLGHWVLADDSGLAVDHLRGAPGVYSARFSGPGATDTLNNEKLLAELAGLPPEQRGAQFVCHLALADPSGTLRAQSQGACRGRILTVARGAQGFGYDPLFEVREYHRTFAELGLVAKAALSHRARALRNLLPALQALVDTGQWLAAEPH